MVHKIHQAKKQDFIADLNNTEIFEFCENSSKQQCLDCDAYWEIGVWKKYEVYAESNRVRPEQP